MLRAVPRWTCPLLLPITPGLCGQGWALLPAAEALHAAGVDALLLREPELPPEQLAPLVEQLAPRFATLLLHVRTPGAKALALAWGLGLHRPAPAEAPVIRAGIGGVEGLSAHTRAELWSAQQAGLDYALLSPVFAPTSKPLDTRPPLGVEGFAEAVRGLHMPVLALGGISPDRARTLRAAGAAGIAVLGGLFDRKFTPDEVYDRAVALQSALRGA